MTDEPQPGEVWVITERQYGPNSYDKIQDYGPFIVTYVSKDQVGFVAAGDGPTPLIHAYQRGRWNWHEHAVRVWPPVPSWDQLKPEVIEAS